MINQVTLTACQQFFIFSSRAYALVSCGKAASLLACLGFACSNFAKKNKRMLTVYASVTFKMASKVFVEETDKNFDFITEIMFRFLGFGDYKVSIVIDN